jgi:AcrR family transcriptional regulator
MSPARTQPKTERRSPGNRLSVEDWVKAALNIMVDEGISGVKVQRLCEILGVTKGSFYWHFADLDAFLEELAKRWMEGSSQPEDIKLGPNADGQSNLMLAMQAFVHPRNRKLVRAMREWAQRDEHAKEAVAAMDRTMLELLRRTFADVGFNRKDSEMRAKILYYTGVGFAHVGPIGRDANTSDQLSFLLELLTQVD